MIIDSHVHLTRPGYVRRRFLNGNARMAASLYNRVHKTSITPEQYIEMVRSRVDPTGENLIAEMNDAGVDASVVFGVDWAYAVTAEPRVGNREQNRYLAEYAARYPGRIIALAAPDPLVRLPHQPAEVLPVAARHDRLDRAVEDPVRDRRTAAHFLSTHQGLGRGDRRTANRHRIHPRGTRHHPRARRAGGVRMLSSWSHRRVSDERRVLRAQRGKRAATCPSGAYS
jgi:hypothetical protein